MVTFVHGKHDVGLLRSDASTKFGLMLAQDKNGKPIYRIDDDEPLAEQRAQGEPGYGWFKPTHQFAIVQDDWREGCGAYFYDSRTPKRSLQSSGVDTRFKNMLIPANKLTSVTKPSHTSPTITNADMELTTGWTGGSRSATYARGGTYSWTLNGANAYQDLTGYVKGITYTFTIYFLRVTGGGGRVGIDDGTTTTWGSTIAPAAETWAQCTVTLRLPLTATRMRIYFEETAGTGACYFDDAALSHTAITVGTVKAWAEYNSLLWASFGTLLAKLNGAGTAFTLVADIGSTITHLEHFADGFLWIGTEDSTVIEDCEDTWTAGASVTCSADTSDYKVGSASSKMEVAVGAGVQVIAYENFSSVDYSQKTGVKFWFKSSVALSAGDWQFLLDDTNNCASPVETINLPAITANTWTRVYLKFAAAASTRTAILSVGLKQAVDKGVMNAWIDDVECEQITWYMNAGEGFTQCTRSDDFAKWFATVNAASPSLYKGLPPNEIKSNTNPSNMSNAWSAATSVDTPYQNITGMFSSENTLYIAKQDRTFYLDSTGAVKVLVDDTRHLTGGSEGKNSRAWQERIYMPYGTQSLVEYDEDGNLNWRDPSYSMTNVTDIDGRIVALAADEHYLYAGVLGTTNIEILAGLYEDVEGVTAWRWHGSLASLAVSTYTSLETMFFSSVYQRRLWIASTAAAADLNYIAVPANYGDPVNDANRSVATDSSASIITPFYHADFQADLKSFFELTVTLGHAHSANIYWTGSYQKLGDTSWTSIGNFDGTSTQRFERLYIPVDGSSNKPTSRAIRFKFVPVTNSATTLPIILSIDCRGKLYPTKRRLIRCVVRCADGLQDKQGMAVGTANDIKTVLDEANTATWPVTFYDLWNTTKTVDFLQMTEVVLTHEKEPHRIEKGYELLLLEQTLS